MWKHMNLNGSRKYISIFAYQYSKLSDLKSVSVRQNKLVQDTAYDTASCIQKKTSQNNHPFRANFSIFLLNQKSNFYNGGM